MINDSVNKTRLALKLIELEMHYSSAIEMYYKVITKIDVVAYKALDEKDNNFEEKNLTRGAQKLNS